MFTVFYPRLYYKSIFSINYDRLFCKGINGLIFDLDNTLAPFDIALPDERTKRLFEDLRQKGFKLCIVSNNGRERVEKFNEPLGAEMVWKAGKPGFRGINRAVELIGGDKAKIAFIGDQLFTDVLCGNLAGIMSILVKPISGRDELSVKLKRIPEKLILRLYFNHRRRGNDRRKN